MTEPKSFDEAARELVDAVEDFVDLEPGAVNSERQLILAWGIKGFGFGQLCFFDRGGTFECDNETMSRTTCKRILDRFVDGLPSTEQLPPLMLRFQTVDALLDACTPHHPGPDWQGPKEKP